MTQQNNAAKYAFFYMLSLVSLIFMSLATGMIVFQIINKKIVDVIQSRGQFSSDQLKFAISALIVSAPIFYITARQIFKNLFSGALDKDSQIRKWLTYFILLISSVVMTGWLIAVVNAFLDGELTLKFILKALTAIGIAAIVFTFYLYDIKRENVMGAKDNVIRAYFYGSLAIVIAVFASSLFIVESPTATRDRKMDNEVLSKLQSLDNSIRNYYLENEKLPVDFGELMAEFSYLGYLGDKDFENSATGERFEYIVKEEKTFELCANFRISNEDESDISHDIYGKEWRHDAGRQCFERKIRETDIIGEPRLKID
ncbi:hypothetical protein KKG85_00530 [Patescibacteria group bacterium]|nr:hypothetical protein [Patescibacteria group bacterium]MBU2579856.1 hypothetical protein [Patescibacteria group bacterium]